MNETIKKPVELAVGAVDAIIHDGHTTPFDFNAEYTHALEHIDSLRQERDRLKGQVKQLRESEDRLKYQVNLLREALRRMLLASGSDKQELASEFAIKVLADRIPVKEMLP